MRKEKRAGILVAGAMLLAVLIGCGGSSNDETGEGGLPATIPVTYVSGQSGPAGYVGESTLKGMELGIEEVNESGSLGDSKLELKVMDTGGNQSTAASQVGEVAASDAVAVFGPATSNETLTAAPVAQREGLPFIALQSNHEGVLAVGDHVYRLTTPQNPLNQLIVDQLVEKGVKSVSLLFASDNTAQVEAAEDYFPDALEEAGIELIDSEGTPMSTTDFSAITSKLMNSNPDAIGSLVVGAQNSTLVSELRRSDYDGEIFGTASLTSDQLAAAGPAADGVFYSHDFAVGLPFESSKQFTKAYRDKFDEDPLFFAGSGYDAARFLASAIEQAGSTDRAAVLDGMKAVAEEGFEGASGPTTFVDPDARDVLVPGALIEWRDGKERIVTVGETE